jgi:hypothetical protein
VVFTEPENRHALLRADPIVDHIPTSRLPSSTLRPWSRDADHFWQCSAYDYRPAGRFTPTAARRAVSVGWRKRWSPTVSLQMLDRRPPEIPQRLLVSLFQLPLPRLAYRADAVQAVVGCAGRSPEE